MFQLYNSMHFYLSHYIKMIHILTRFFLGLAYNLFWFLVELGEASPLIVDTLKALLREEEKEKQQGSHLLFCDPIYISANFYVTFIPSSGLRFRAISVKLP